MTTLFHSNDGQYPHGADVLREQLRWTKVERRRDKPPDAGGPCWPISPWPAPWPAQPPSRVLDHMTPNATAAGRA